MGGFDGANDDALATGMNDEEVPERSPLVFVGGAKGKPQDSPSRVGIKVAFGGTELMGLQSVAWWTEHFDMSPTEAKGAGYWSMGRNLDSASGSVQL